MTTNLFDLFVIGAGSGGVRAARIAATHGARVGIAEESRYGGTCVIRGCVPKKLYVYAGRFAEEFHDAAGFGWTLERARFDWRRLVDAKEREITRLEGIYRDNLVKAGVQHFPQRARLGTRASDKHPFVIELSDNNASGGREAAHDGGSRARTIHAKRVLIATGGRPTMPPLTGIELAISSDEVFDLPRFPERMLIVGAGYIALEFASILAHLGSQVTVVHRGERLLRGFDGEIADRLAKAFAARGIALRFSTQVERIAKGEGGRRVVTLDDGSTLEVDQVMCATGRHPNSKDLGLEGLGVALGHNGRIVVDDFSATNVPGLFAVGDVTDRLALTPVAIREGHAFADTCFADRPWTADHERVPTAVFTTPEIGTVGLSEDEVLESHAVVDVYTADFRSMKATLSGSAERVFYKLLVDVDSDRIVGAQLMGPDAGEHAQLFATLLRMGVRKRDLDGTMPLHPSATEELMTMRTRTRRLVRETRRTQDRTGEHE